MRTCMLIMSILLASAVLKAQPLVVYTSEDLDPRSDKYCPYCVFKVGESEKRAREGGIPTHVRVYTSEDLDPRSDRYCPYCVFRVNEAERQAREREITDEAKDALRQFDRLRKSSNRE